MLQTTRVSAVWENTFNQVVRTIFGYTLRSLRLAFAQRGRMSVAALMLSMVTLRSAWWQRRWGPVTDGLLTCNLGSKLADKVRLKNVWLAAI